MPTYQVTSKSSGDAVYRYQADEPVEWNGFEFALFDHVEVADQVIEAPPKVVIVWDQIAFLRRFMLQERIAARELAKTDPVMADLWGLLTSAPAVHSNDPDVIRGLGYMVQVGILTVHRRDQIIGDAE